MYIYIFFSKHSSKKNKDDYIIPNLEYLSLPLYNKNTCLKISYVHVLNHVNLHFNEATIVFENH